MKESRKIFVAFVLLMGFIFNFAHSELDFLVPESDMSHYTHDFCQIVDSASVKNTQIINLDFLKIVHPGYADFCIISDIKIHSQTQLKYSDNNSPGKTEISGTPLFVINRSLLI